MCNLCVLTIDRLIFLFNSMTAHYFFDKIIWSPDGQHYALSLNTKLMIYNVETAGIAYTIEDNQKIHGVTFLTVIKNII